MENETSAEDLIANAMSVLSEFNGTLIVTNGCMCCRFTPISGLKIIQLPPIATSKSQEGIAIGFFICQDCRDGAYDRDKTFENLETFFSGDVTLL